MRKGCFSGYIGNAPSLALLGPFIAEQIGVGSDPAHHPESEYGHPRLSQVSTRRSCWWRVWEGGPQNSRYKEMIKWLYSCPNHHVLIVVDNFTKFAIAVPTHDQTSNNAAQIAWKQFCLLHGCLQKTHSDQCPCFKREFIREYVGKVQLQPYPYVERPCPWEAEEINILLGQSGLEVQAYT